MVSYFYLLMILLLNNVCIAGTGTCTSQQIEVAVRREGSHMADMPFLINHVADMPIIINHVAEILFLINHMVDRPRRF